MKKRQKIFFCFSCALFFFLLFYFHYFYSTIITACATFRSIVQNLLWNIHLLEKIFLYKICSKILHRSIKNKSFQKHGNRDLNHSYLKYHRHKTCTRLLKTRQKSFIICRIHITRYTAGFKDTITVIGSKEDFNAR